MIKGPSHFEQANRGDLAPSGWIAFHPIAQSSRIIALAFCVFYSMVLFANAARVSVDDPLWRKAVEIAGTNADWVPGLTITRVEIFHKGKRQGLREMWYRSKLGEKRNVITETVKVLEDGKDVTEDEKKDKEKNSLKIGSEAGANPFHPKIQEDLTLEPVLKC